MDFVACSLRNFFCSDYNGPMEIKINRGLLFFLLFQEPEVISVVRSYRYYENFGLIEAERLWNNFVCYQVFKESVTDNAKRGLLANNLHTYAQLLSKSLWFVKDNAVTPYFSTVSSDTVIDPHCLRRNVYFSNSRGNYESTSFSAAEIDEAMKWLQILDNYTLKIESNKFEYSEGLTNMTPFIPLDSSSFQRALDYLENTRKTDFLPSKISTYITILELLFCVKGDNTHKVAERTSTFIGKNNDDRIKLFKQITSAYDIRSSYVHGSEIKNSKMELLPDTCEALDSIVRRVMSEMIINYPELNYKNKKDRSIPNSKDSEEVNEWFNHLVLNRE